MWKSFGISSLVSVIAISAHAEPVLLKSLDGRMSVTGEIIGHDGDTATIQSDLGVVNVPIALMTCKGAACASDITWAQVEKPAGPKEMTVAVKTGKEREILGVLTASLDEVSEFEVAASSRFGVGVETLTIDNTEDGETVSLQVQEGGNDASIRFENVAGAAAAATGLDMETVPTTQLVGMNAFSVIAHEGVNVDAISVEDLAKIYAGEITNWSELGGVDRKIVALKREPESIDLIEFETLVMAPFQRTVAPEVLAVPGDEKMAEYVDTLAGGIGVVNASYVETENVIPVLSSCGSQETATPFGVASGDYPLSRPLFAVHDNDVGDATVALFDTATTQDAQSALSEVGLLETKVTEAVATAKSLRLKSVMEGDWPKEQQATAKALVELMFVSNRLSTTFRSGDLTDGDAAWNRAQMLQLSDLLQTGAYDDYELVFAGFSHRDATEAATQAAAGEVMAAFQSLMTRLGGSSIGPQKFTAMGFGAVTSNDCAQLADTQGNRNRIEVWIRPTVISG